MGAVLKEFKLMLTPDDSSNLKPLSKNDNWDSKRVGRWLCIQHMKCGAFEMFDYGTENISGVDIPHLDLEMLVRIADGHVCS